MGRILVQKRKHLTMTFTGTLKDLWDSFKTSGFQIVIGMGILGFLGFMFFTLVMHCVGQCKHPSTAKACAIFVFIAASAIVFLFLYGNMGTWERHFLSKDTWKPNWKAIMLAQFVASLILGVASVVGYEEGKKSKPHGLTDG
jgi:hypothetical protein